MDSFDDRVLPSSLFVVRSQLQLLTLCIESIGSLLAKLNRLPNTFFAFSCRVSDVNELAVRLRTIQTARLVGNAVTATEAKMSTEIAGNQEEYFDLIDQEDSNQNPMLRRVSRNLSSMQRTLASIGRAMDRYGPNARLVDVVSLMNGLRELNKKAEELKNEQLAQLIGNTVMLGKD